MWPDQGNLPLAKLSATAILSKRRSEVLSSRLFVQRLYGHRLNQIGTAKRQSSPRTLQERRRKPKRDETEGRRSESCRGYSRVSGRSAKEERPSMGSVLFLARRG